jgi:hypothetical protein
MQYRNGFFYFYFILQKSYVLSFNEKVERLTSNKINPEN